MKIALIGYGKMGKAIEEIARAQGHTIALIIDHENAGEAWQDQLEHVDVAIEFTGAESAFANILKCFDAGIPVVCGSTGWIDYLPQAETYCRDHNGTFLYASNFSIGVNIFFAINSKLASLMANHAEYDVSIKEIHHTQKKDIPSGTAISLADQIIREIPGKTHWDLTHGNEETIVIHSERVDPAPGTHHVLYHSDIDDIEIIHTAHSRKGFASGALAAAAFIADKKGIYSMRDVLGLY
jgi:4-hydroxy-tetrahydrodipicolinate reductase